jgi:hypothetical protein
MLLGCSPCLMAGQAPRPACLQDVAMGDYLPVGRHVHRHFARIIEGWLHWVQHVRCSAAVYAGCIEARCRAAEVQPLVC